MNKKNLLDSHSDDDEEANLYDDEVLTENGEVKGIVHENMTFKQKFVYFFRVKWIKFTIILVAFLGFLAIKFSGTISSESYDKPRDKLFELFAPINRHINNNHTFAFTWEIISSLNLDSLAVLLCIVFILRSKSYRIWISILIFYGVRGILQMLQTLPIPEGMFWDYPGFPSLVNIYGRTSDFFYSGHIGFCLLCTIEFFMTRLYILGVYGIFSIIFMAITMLSFRGHYTIDLFAGLILAHYTYMITGFFIKYIDRYLMNKNEFQDKENSVLN